MILFWATQLVVNKTRTRTQISQVRVCVCAKSLQLCSTLCDPKDYGPPDSSVHGHSPGKNTGVDCHALLQGFSPPRNWTWVSCLASVVAQRLKHLPAMRETWVRSLGREVPLEKEMATHSSILAWRIPRTEEPGGLQFTGSQRVRHNWATSLHFNPGLFAEEFYSNGSKAGLWIRIRVCARPALL